MVKEGKPGPGTITNHECDIAREEAFKRLALLVDSESYNEDSESDQQDSDSDIDSDLVPDLGSEEVHVDSVRLSAALDEIGASEDKLVCWISTVKQAQAAHNFRKALNEDTVILSGGQVQGTITKTKGYDFDVMLPLNLSMSCKCALFTEKPVSLEQIKNSSSCSVFYMQNDNVRSGYVLVYDICLPERYLAQRGFSFQIGDDIVHHEDMFPTWGSLVTSHLSTRMIKEIFSRSIKDRIQQDLKMNGPAATYSGYSGEEDWKSMTHLSPIDFVPCLRCNLWPSQASEWLTRHRKFNWPSSEQLETMKEQGCLIVPTGYEALLTITS